MPTHAILVDSSRQDEILTVLSWFAEGGPIDCSFPGEIFFLIGINFDKIWITARINRCSDRLGEVLMMRLQTCARVCDRSVRIERAHSSCQINTDDGQPTSRVRHMGSSVVPTYAPHSSEGER